MAGHRRRRAEQQRSARQKAIKQRRKDFRAQPKQVAHQGFHARIGLRPYIGSYHIFVARFDSHGHSRTGHRTFLLHDVVHRDSGIVVADHVWTNTLAELSACTLRPGTLLEIVACPLQYWKGTKGDDNNPFRYDFNLGDICNARVLRLNDYETQAPDRMGDDRMAPDNALKR